MKTAYEVANEKLEKAKTSRAKKIEEINRSIAECELTISKSTEEFAKCVNHDEVEQARALSDEIERCKKDINFYKMQLQTLAKTPLPLDEINALIDNIRTEYSKKVVNDAKSIKAMCEKILPLLDEVINHRSQGDAILNKLHYYIDPKGRISIEPLQNNPGFIPLRNEINKFINR